MPKNPIQIKCLDHVVLRVRDLSQAMAFYEDVIGCALERRIDEIGLVQLRAGASLIDLVGVDTPLGRAGGSEPSVTGPNVDHFALTLEEFDSDSIRSHLERHDIESGDPATRYGAEGFGPSLYIKDPDGNTVELKGPPEAPDERVSKADD